jgi:biopolymer transport protein TolQ
MDSLAAPRPGGVIGIVLTTSPFAKFILLILLVFSIISWAIIIRKWLYFRAVRGANRSYLSLFRHRGNLVQFAESGGRFEPSALPTILDEALLEWQRLVPHGSAGRIPAEVYEVSMRIVTDVMTRRISSENESYEKQLSFLATAGSASPFLGLLGTVWGIMKSFMDIRGLATVNVQTVAPGIADALIVTAAGLLVAVPAVIFYNHFLSQINVLGAAMERFSSEVAGDLRREFIKEGKG